MEIIGVIMKIFFIGVFPFGVIAALLIAGVMALAGKKIKRGVWIGVCAFGVLQMIGTELLYLVWAQGRVFTVFLYLLGRWIGCLCAAGFVMLAPTGKKKPALVALLLPAVLYIVVANLVDFASIMDDMLLYKAGFREVIINLFNGIRWQEGFFVVAVILLAAWYMTGRKKALSVVVALLSAVTLLTGCINGIRVVCLYFGPTFAEAMAGSSPFLVYNFGWMPSFCILLTQMIQLGLLSGKLGQEKAAAAREVEAPVYEAPKPAAEPVAEPAAAPASAPKFCAHCGKPLPEGGFFCGHCGRKI